MPDITSQLLEQVLEARLERRCLQIVGGGSKEHYGRPSRGSKIELSGHQGIISYQPDELVLTVRCGTRIEVIQALLAEKNQMLASDPPQYNGAATIGGSVACNDSGPGRPWTGSIRDSVLGIQLITGKGEKLQFGGRVMKNVAGYDVSRLQCGAMGCMGIVSEVSLKVMPRPAHSLTMKLEINSHIDALEHMSLLARSAYPISGNCWIDGIQYVRFEGAYSAVEKAAKDYARLFPDANELRDGSSFWGSVRDHHHSFFRSSRRLWRLSIHPTAQYLELEPGLLDWSGAQRWIPGEHNMTEMVAALSPIGGNASLIKGGIGEEDVFHPMDEGSQRLHVALKSKFDPDRIFNPGRMYSWL